MSHVCPDEETLAAYFDGLLPPEAEAALHRELASCPDCARLASALGLVLEAEPPDAWERASVPAAVTRAAIDLWPAEPGPVHKALRLAARWLDDQFQPLADALAPTALAGVAVRGPSAPAPELHYELTLGDLPLDIDLEPDGPNHFALTVRPQTPPPPSLLLRLTTAGETRALCTLDASGTTLPALPPGDYDLTLERGPDQLGHLTLTLESDQPPPPIHRRR